MAVPFPASAGMSRWPACPAGGCGPVPRVRGDEPGYVTAAEAATARSPRPRG